MLRWLYLDCSIMTERSKTRERFSVAVSLPAQCQRVQTVWRMPTGNSCVMQNPHNQITWNNFKQPVLSALLQLWHMDGVRTTDLSFLLPGTCPWKGPLLPPSKKWCSMTALPTEQTVLGRKAWWNSLLPSCFAAARALQHHPCTALPCRLRTFHAHYGLAALLAFGVPGKASVIPSQLLCCGFCNC